MDAGWQTEDLDLGGGTVTFRRDTSLERAVKTDSAGRISHPLRGRNDTPVHDWDRENHVEFHLRFDWSPIGGVVLDPAGKLAFPKAKPVPGLYRFRLREAGREARYIGETDNLLRRFSHYRNPGPSQETNRYVTARFREALAAGGEISVAIVTGALSADFGQGSQTLDLTFKFVRRFAENAALVERGGVEIETMNRE